MTSSLGLRRAPEQGERLVRCKRCGEVDLPLNERELWHYVRTGEGLGTDCPKHLRGCHEWAYEDSDALTLLKDTP